MPKGENEDAEGFLPEGKAATYRRTARSLIFLGRERTHRVDSPDALRAHTRAPWNTDHRQLVRLL
eukprot:2641194-Alexandrium_andersonii.AAC.1